MSDWKYIRTSKGIIKLERVNFIGFSSTGSILIYLEGEEAPAMELEEPEASTFISYFNYLDISGG